MTLRFNLALFKFRLPVAALALLFILYCNVYMWFYVPPDDYEFTWSPDTELRIVSIPEGSLAKAYLKPGDLILEIDGHPIHRMQMLYPLPLKSIYQFTIQRDGKVLDHDIPVPDELTSLAVKNQLPTTLLSLVGWTVGAMLLLFSKQKDNQAIHAGFIFLLASSVLVGIQAGQDGTPFAWVGGQTLVFFLLVAWPLLGLIPRQRPIGYKTSLFLKLLFGLATSFSFLAIYEILFLYPQNLSMEELVGVSLYSSGFILAAIGLVIFVLLLIWRAANLPNSSYLRQQINILLLFVAIGVFPIVFLTILPEVFLDSIFLPFPIAITLMDFIPAGFLFVIFRRSFLGLDPFFSHTIYLALLALIVFGFYTGGLYLVQRILNLNGPGAVLPATIVFFPSLLLAIYLNQPIKKFVQQLVYGPAALNQDVLTRFALALSARPEISTLNEILASLTNTLNSSNGLLVFRNELGQYASLSTRGDLVKNIDTQSIPEYKEPIVRATIPDNEIPQMFRQFNWAELILPLHVRDEQVGILALSSPGNDGYFNAQQVSYLRQAAGMLAVASENIRLFEATRNLAMRAQVAQEKERQRLALEIHDAPLQEITFVTNTLDHVLFNFEHLSNTNDVPSLENVVKRLKGANQHLREAALDLRDICVGLYPPSRDQGILVLTQTITNEFREKFGLKIELNIEDSLKLVDIQGGEAIVLTISHVLSEALTNVVKHASATEVCVTLNIDEENLYLTIVDNGPGTPIRSLSELVRQGQLGIVGMFEWARYAGGHLKLSNVRPQGLAISLTCPISSTVLI